MSKEKVKRYNGKERAVITITAILLVITLIWAGARIGFAVYQKKGETVSDKYRLTLISKVNDYFSDGIDVDLTDGTKDRFYFEIADEYEQPEAGASWNQYLGFVKLYADPEKTQEITAGDEIGGGTGADIKLFIVFSLLNDFETKILKPYHTALTVLFIADFVLVIFSAYIIWGKKYDEKLARDREMNEQSAQRRSGMSEDEARKRPNNYTKKKQRRRK